jgi:hypothetical protein
MSLNQRWKMLGALLLVIMAILVVTPGAWSQTKYQTLHRFQERYGRSKDGLGPVAGLTFDRVGNPTALQSPEALTPTARCSS